MSGRDDRERTLELDHLPTVPTLLARARATFGDADHVVARDGRLSFRDAEERSAAFACQLLDAVVGKGTRVGIVLPSSIDFAVAFYAVARVGAVAMLFSSTYRPPELSRVLRLSDASLVVAPRTLLGRDYQPQLVAAIAGLDGASQQSLRLSSHPYLRSIWTVGGADHPWATGVDLTAPKAPSGWTRELLEEVESEVTPADWLLTIYTSGSSADPKGVLHTHGAAVRKVHPTSVMGLQASRPGERVFMAMPFFWVGGPQSLLGSLHTGSTIVCQERFDPVEALELIERERVTVVAGWPTMLDTLRSDPSAVARDLSSVAPAPPLGRSAQGDPINMGMTETFGPHRNRAYFDYKVIDPDTGEPLPDGQEGEFCVRGFGLTVGLYKREREDTFDADGWYHTGDRGYIEDGAIYFRGRISEMIKSAGANVAPLEVETVLAGFPGVAQAHVFGIPHASRGEEVVAIVVPTSGDAVDLEALRAHALREISSYKVPTRFLIIDGDAVPTLPSGKPDKRTMRARLLDG